MEQGADVMEKIMGLTLKIQAHEEYTAELTSKLISHRAHINMLNQHNQQLQAQLASTKASVKGAAENPQNDLRQELEKVKGQLIEQRNRANAEARERQSLEKMLSDAARNSEANKNHAAELTAMETQLFTTETKAKEYLEKIRGLETELGLAKASAENQTSKKPRVRKKAATSDT